MSRHCSQACWVVWVTTEAFSITIEIFWLCVMTGIQCRDKVCGWAKFRVTTRVSLCRNRVFPEVGHSCRDRRLYVATEISRVVLRQDVFLLQPTGQACAHYRALDAYDRPGLPALQTSQRFLSRQRILYRDRESRNMGFHMSQHGAYVTIVHGRGSR